MTWLLVSLAVLADELLRYVAHHRTGLSALLASAAASAGARTRIPLLAPHTGQRAQGMAELAPIATRRPDLTRRTA